MKQTLKITCACFLAILMLMTAAVPAFAYDAAWGEELTVEGDFSYQLNPDGSFRYLVYRGYESEGKEAHIPKTIAGITLTPDNFDSTVFTSMSWHLPESFTVDDDNEYFKVIDGALCTKDGKILVMMPWKSSEAVCIVPDGIEMIKKNSLYYENCVVIPASVTSIEGTINCNAIAGYPGTTAETYANAHKKEFVPLGQGHKHAYFRGIVQQATCVSALVYELVCPCGEQRLIETEEYGDHYFARWEYDEATGEDLPTVCEYCGKTWEDAYGEPYEYSDYGECSCSCHNIGGFVSDSFGSSDPISFLRDFFLRLRILFWRISGTHKYCECGKRHY
ncbi:MAG: hypothetical protein K6G90_02345 [Clostridia bacterium]|nr:hypothetical protein [Clostridia bacterium]